MTAAARAAATDDPIAVSLPLDDLQPAPNQPRTTSDEAKLDQLTASIRARGRLVQAIVARPLGDGRHEIVCGERRWRAARAAGLTEIPVIVRALSDQDAFEESLAENLDREDMSTIDEVRAVARLAAEHGVVEAARRIGKPHQWLSKRKRIAEAPAFVLEFVQRGGSADVEALYELAKLAEGDVAAAEAIISEHTEGGGLREAVKVAAREARQERRSEDGAGRDGGAAENEVLSEESFRLEDRGAAAAAAGADDDGDDGDEERGDEDGEPEPSWLPSDAPELDQPFDADPPVLVTGVEVRRAGHLVFATSNGPITYELTAQAREQLRALLG